MRKPWNWNKNIFIHSFLFDVFIHLPGQFGFLCGSRICWRYGIDFGQRVRLWFRVHCLKVFGALTGALTVTVYHHQDDNEYDNEYQHLAWSNPYLRHADLLELHGVSLSNRNYKSHCDKTNKTKTNNRKLFFFFLFFNYFYIVSMRCNNNNNQQYFAAAHSIFFIYLSVAVRGKHRYDFGFKFTSEYC